MGSFLLHRCVESKATLNTSTTNTANANIKTTPKRIDSYPSEINPFGTDDDFTDDDNNNNETVVPEPTSDKMNNSNKLKENNMNLVNNNGNNKKAPAIPTSIPRPISNSRLATPPKNDTESNKENVTIEKPVNELDMSSSKQNGDEDDDNKHTYANE